MKLRWLPTLLLAVASLATTLPVPAQQRPLKVLLLSSETGHPYPQTTPILCKTLLDAGFDLELTMSLERVKAPGALDRFDVIVFNGRYPARDEVAEKALCDFVAGGKGIAIIHIASNSFLGSSEWNRLCGRIWGPGSSHPPYGSFKVTVTDRQHPIMQGIGDFEIEDEMYQRLVVAPGVQEQILATATDGQRTDPMVIALTYGQGRVFHTTLGHGPVCHRTPVFQKLVVQGTEWAGRRR